MISQIWILFSRRARRKRGDDDGDDDEEEDGGDEEEPKDSDVEMEDVPSSRKARPRKSDASEEGVAKQSRAERLSARTQAKVSVFKDTFYWLFTALQEKLSTGSKKGATPASEEDE